MTTTVIMVDNTGIIEISQLSREFVAHLSEMVDVPKSAKTAKVRKTKIWTSEEKAAFRAKMVEARAKKAAADVKVEPVKAEVNSKLDPKARLATKPVKSSTMGSMDLTPEALVIPRTVHKVESKRAVE